MPTSSITPIVAVVTVVDGVSDDVSVFVQQRVIHSPGIDSQTLDRLSWLPLFQSLFPVRDTGGKVSSKVLSRYAPDHWKNGFTLLQFNFFPSAYLLQRSYDRFDAQSQRQIVNCLSHFVYLSIFCIYSAPVIRRTPLFFQAAVTHSFFGVLSRTRISPSDKSITFTKRRAPVSLVSAARIVVREHSCACSSSHLLPSHGNP